VAGAMLVKVPVTPSALMLAVLLPEPEVVSDVVDFPEPVAATETVCVRVDVTLMVAPVSTPSVESNSPIVGVLLSVVLVDPAVSRSVTLPLTVKVCAAVVTVKAPAGTAATVPSAAATAAARAVGLGVMAQWDR
jgi:hypothetical protein